MGSSCSVVRRFPLNSCRFIIHCFAFRFNDSGPSRTLSFSVFRPKKPQENTGNALHVLYSRPAPCYTCRVRQRSRLGSFAFLLGVALCTRSAVYSESGPRGKGRSPGMCSVACTPSSTGARKAAASRSPAAAFSAISRATALSVKSLTARPSTAWAKGTSRSATSATPPPAAKTTTISSPSSSPT